MPTTIKGEMRLQYNHLITGRIIWSLRKEQSLTQEVLSGLAAIFCSHLAEIETGQCRNTVKDF